MRDRLQQPVALQRPVGIPGEHLEQVELARGQRFLRAVGRIDQHALLHIEHAATHAHARACGRGRAGGTPQDAFHAGEQLARLERLGDVIVSPGFQSNDAVDGVGGGRDPRVPVLLTCRFAWSAYPQCSGPQENGQPPIYRRRRGRGHPAPAAGRLPGRPAVPRQRSGSRQRVAPGGRARAAVARPARRRVADEDGFALARWLREKSARIGLRKAKSFKGESQVATWLLAIARNKTIALLRQRAFVALDETEAGAIEDLSDNPESVLDKKSHGTLLQKCLKALSPNHRQIIDLVYYQSKSPQEVADIVGVPLNTVKTRMFYARNHLGKVLKQAGVEHAYA